MKGLLLNPCANPSIAGSHREITEVPDFAPFLQQFSLLQLS